MNYLKILDLVFEEGVAQMSWSILNDACVSTTPPNIQGMLMLDCRLLTPLYAIHPPHVLACTSILLATRLLRIALPPDWHVLFDVDYDDLWSSCGVIMQLWKRWGTNRVTNADWGPAETDEAAVRDRDNLWRRSWILMESRKSVRRWIEGSNAVPAT